MKQKLRLSAFAVLRIAAVLLLNMAMLTSATSVALSQSFDLRSEIHGYVALKDLANNNATQINLKLDSAQLAALKEQWQLFHSAYRGLQNPFIAESARDHTNRMKDAMQKFDAEIADVLQEILTPSQRQAYAWTFLRGRSNTITHLFSMTSFQKYLRIESDVSGRINEILGEQVKATRELSRKCLLESVNCLSPEQQDRVRDIVGSELLPLPSGRNYRLSNKTPVPTINSAVAVMTLSSSDFMQEYVHLRQQQLDTINSWIETARGLDASAIEEVVGPNGLRNLLDKEQYVLLGQLDAQQAVGRGGLTHILRFEAYKQYIAPTSEQLRTISDLEITHQKAREDQKKEAEKEATKKIVAALTPESRMKLRELLGEELSFSFAVGNFD